MITTSEWIWLHVPKCGGTSCRQILHSVFSNNKTVVFDKVGPNHPVIWHHTVDTRKAHDPSFSIDDRNVIGNIRRLPYWMLSRIHFEYQRFGSVSMVDRDQFIKGIFRGRPNNKGAPGNLSSADRQITMYAKDVTDWIRTENLFEDIGRVFNVTAGQIAKTKLHTNVGKINYIRDLGFWFNQTELETLYKENPVWAALEKEIYGEILTV